MRRMAWMFAFLLVIAIGACGSADHNSVDVGGGQQRAVGLERALLATADASRYRITLSVGQTISIPAFGLDSDLPIDEENPTIVGEVAPDATHLRIDLTTMSGALLGDDAPSLRLEIWTGPDRMVLDTRDHAAIAERNPSANLGPFEPGVSFIDLEAVRDRPDFLAALVGQGVADPGSWLSASPTPSRT